MVSHPCCAPGPGMCNTTPCKRLIYLHFSRARCKHLKPRAALITPAFLSCFLPGVCPPRRASHAVSQGDSRQERLRSSHWFLSPFQLWDPLPSVAPAGHHVSLPISLFLVSTLTGSIFTVFFFFLFFPPSPPLLPVGLRVRSAPHPLIHMDKWWLPWQCRRRGVAHSCRRTENFNTSLIFFFFHLSFWS